MMQGGPPALPQSLLRRVLGPLERFFERRDHVLARQTPGRGDYDLKPPAQPERFLGSPLLSGGLALLLANGIRGLGGSEPLFDHLLGHLLLDGLVLDLRELIA